MWASNLKSSGAYFNEIVATSDKADQNNMLSYGPVSSLPTHKRSPTKRNKSRWEPIPEEKLVEKIASVSNEPVKDANGNQISETERMVQPDTRKHDPKDNGSSF